MSDMQKNFERREYKYLLTKEQMNVFIGAFSMSMLPDKHSRSSVRNVYYDTPDRLLIRRSVEKPVYKEKLRVRCYGKAGPDDAVYVELKKKYRHVVYKRRITLKEEEATRYLKEGFMQQNRTQIISEIDFFLKRYNDLTPSVFLSYERCAFVGKENSGLRITFDRNILWRDTELSLASETWGEPLLGPDQTLMEIKTTTAIPLWLSQLLSREKLYKTSFSKYGNAYLTMLRDKGGVYCA